MNSRLACAGVALVIAALVGCLPETRVSWSPDGKCALVRGGDGLYLCDAEGKLSPRVAEDVVAMAWLPDSRQFIAVSRTSAATWEQLLPHLSDARKVAAKAEAEAFRQEILAYKGDWDNFVFKTPSADILAALMCLRDLYGKELEPMAGPRWSGIKDLDHKVFPVKLFEVADGQAKAGKMLFESLEPVAEVRVAPTGKAFAYVAPPYPALGAEAAFALFAVSLASPDKPRCVANRVSIFFDWTTDGRSLVYACANDPDPQAAGRAASPSSNAGNLVYLRERMPEFGRQPPYRPGGIVRSQVVAEDGTLASQPEFARLAMVFYFDSLPVRCLRSGKVLFAAKDSHLPAVPADLPAGLALFTVDLMDPKTVDRLPIQPGLSAALDLMQLSPDESRVCVPAGQDVRVLDLATGQATTVSGGMATGRGLPLPAWRSKDDLCFAVKAGSNLGSPGRAELVLWSPAGSRCLSKDWPAPAVEGFLGPKTAKAEPSPPAAAAAPADAPAK